MNKHIVFAICGCLFFVTGFSQTKNVEELLNEIEQNNTELKGYQSFIESKQLENKSTNNLPDPQLSGYYMPFGDNITGDYTEYEISQSFEFPSVYGARGKWNESKSQQLVSAYSIKRQEVLLQAKGILLELVFLQKQKTIETERKIQSKQVFDQIKELFAKEQVGILDLNKAKIAWIQEQFVVKQIESDIQIQMSKLKTLNGNIKGEDFAWVQFDFNSGALGFIDANRYNESTADDPRLTFGTVLIEGNKGSIRLYEDGKITIQNLGEKEIVHSYTFERKNFSGDCVYVTQKHFTECLQTGSPFETEVSQYLKNIAVQEAIYESNAKDTPTLL